MNSSTQNISAAKPEPAAPSSTGAEPGHVNILIVDDDLKNLAAIESVLTAPDHRLVRATSAHEALLALMEEEFALIVLDIQLPDMDGFELAHLIKKRKKSADIPIIFLTAYYADDEHIMHGYKTGAVDYLHKPFNPAILRSKTAVFTELHIKAREVQAANARLAIEIAQRCAAQEELLKLNEVLEDRIRERTRDLQSSEARKDAIFNSALDAIITIDHEGRIVEFNPAAERIFGYTRAAALNRPLENLFLPAQRPEDLWHDMTRELESGQSRLLNRLAEVPAVRADGSHFPAELAMVRVATVEPPMFTAFLRDITRRKSAEEAMARRAEELARAGRNKDEFLAMLAHELRNPLAPIRGAAEILTAADATPAERSEAQTIMTRQIGNMARMIDDLLDVSRITQGKIELRRDRVLLNPILESASLLAGPICAQNNQLLRVSLPVTPIALEADATRLEQVLSNLLGNACKYSGKGSQIWLSAERAPGSGPPHVEIIVRDDGEGIDPDLLPSVFGLFVQASRSLDRSQGGLGIGLTLVERLVQLHGGSVEARSEGLGKGATFIVRLPILETIPHPPAAVQRVPDSGTSRRILIVDDNVDAARTLAILQTRRGHKAITAFSGPEAVETAETFRPEVVLLDIGLPGMDGLEVARRLRNAPTSSKIFIIAMSGYGRNQDVAAAREAGIDEYMVKPVDMDCLHSLIGSWSEKSNASTRENGSDDEGSSSPAHG